MWGSTDALEIKIEVERKLNDFEDMLKKAFPDLNKCPNEKISDYTDKKIKSAQCEDVPGESVFPIREWNMLYELSKKSGSLAVYHALIVGFMNGVAWEREKSEIPS